MRCIRGGGSSQHPRPRRHAAGEAEHADSDRREGRHRHANKALPSSACRIPQPSCKGRQGQRGEHDERHGPLFIRRGIPAASLACSRVNEKCCEANCRHREAQSDPRPCPDPTRAIGHCLPATQNTRREPDEHRRGHHEQHEGKPLGVLNPRDVSRPENDRHGGEPPHACERHDVIPACGITPAGDPDDPRQQPDERIACQQHPHGKPAERDRKFVRHFDQYHHKERHGDRDADEHLDSGGVTPRV